MKFLKTYIKKKFNKLYFLNVGDIVLCKRYNNTYEKEFIPEGHREGPYIIIKKTLTETYGIYLTSSLKELRYDNKFIELENSDLKKQTYINTDKIEKININRYIKFIGKLKENELNYINKVLYVKDIFNLFNNKKLKYYFDIGDIVKKKNNHLYYIYDKDKDYLYLYSINKTKKSRNPIIINNNIYSFNFESSSYIKKNTKLFLIDTTYRNDLILRKKEIYLKNKLLKNIVKRGDIIKHKNELYYIYGEESNNWLVYLIYDKKKKFEIKINNKSYYTEFFNDTINKKEKLCILRSSKETEMNYIKELRKKNKNIIRNNISMKKVIGGNISINYNILKGLSFIK